MCKYKVENIYFVAVFMITATRTTCTIYASARAFSLKSYIRIEPLTGGARRLWFDTKRRTESSNYLSRRRPLFPFDLEDAPGVIRLSPSQQQEDLHRIAEKKQRKGTTRVSYRMNIDLMSRLDFPRVESDNLALTAYLSPTYDALITH